MKTVQSALVAAILATPTHAAAALITFQYHGVVTTVFPALSGSFSVGDPLTVTYTFDSLTPDASPADPVHGTYPAITSISVSLGGYSASGPGAGHREIEVFNNDNILGIHFDRYNVFASVSGPSVAGLDPLAFYFQLDDSTFSVFGDKALPLSQPDVAAFDSSAFYLEFSNGQESAFVGGKLVPDAVPEPGSFALITAGLVAAFGSRRRRRRQGL